MAFSKLGLSKALLEAISKQEYTSVYPIQEQAIPAILVGKDVQGIAKTGSGKTASFVLPILEQFQKKKLSRKLHLKVLILVPTRELAMQISGVITSFSEELPIQVKNLAVYGGVKLNQQMVLLKDTEILVATPGRLLDLISTQSVNLGKIEMLVLDEADKMLDLGFQEELQSILKLLPKKRQNLLFSATLDGKISGLKKGLLHEPVTIEIEEEEEDELELIKQTAYMVSQERKGPLLRYLITNKGMSKVLVFTSSIRTADNVVTKLNKNGIKASAIHSKKTQGARNRAMMDFKLGEISVLVATDLASRGIDIHFLPTVVNYELPRSPKDYIHRIGRTGRAGASGEAISFVTEEDEHHFYIIQKKMGKRVEKIDASEFDLGNI
jgi:ATP-dependent RNA helicase RhlE